MPPKSFQNTTVRWRNETAINKACKSEIDVVLPKLHVSLPACNTAQATRTKAVQTDELPVGSQWDIILLRMWEDF